MSVDFDSLSQSVAQRITAGLAKIGAALKARAWRAAGPEGLTPTQGEVLTLLKGAPDGLRLTSVARALAITSATASDAVTSLVAKRLVWRGTAVDDRRAIALTLTSEGASLADRVAGWPDFLIRAVDTLTLSEQEMFLRALVKMVHSLQDAGDIPIQRMCVTCRYFRPNAYPDDFLNPHHCAFVSAPFGDRHLRLDCGEHEEEADPRRRAASWERFLSSNCKETRQ